MTEAAALTREQKMLNQRLLAEHCLDEASARQLWNQLSSHSNVEHTTTTTLEEAVKACNQQLQSIGLEIVAVAMRPKPDDDDCTDDDAHVHQKYFCLINKFPDEITKLCFAPLFTPPQHAYVRTVLEKLVDGPVKRSTLLNARHEPSAAAHAADHDNENDDDDNPPSNTTTTTPTALPLAAAETVLDTLQDEKWLTKQDTSALTFAPRAYAELSYLLQQEFGMDPEELPQQIFYR